MKFVIEFAVGETAQPKNTPGTSASLASVEPSTTTKLLGDVRAMKTLWVTVFTVISPSLRLVIGKEGTVVFRVSVVPLMIARAPVLSRET